MIVFKTAMKALLTGWVKFVYHWKIVKIMALGNVVRIFP